MGMRDQYDNVLLEPAYPREPLAYEEVWGVYRVQDGCHTGECVSRRGMTLDEARDDAQKRNAQIQEGAGYRFYVYRCNPRTKYRTPFKPGPRKL
jgi:hypothetical protein